MPNAGIRDEGWLPIMTLGHVFYQQHIDGFSVESLLDCQQHRKETSSTVTYAHAVTLPAQHTSLPLPSAHMHTEPDNDG